MRQRPHLVPLTEPADCDMCRRKTPALFRYLVGTEEFWKLCRYHADLYCGQSQDHNAGGKRPK